MRLDNTFEVGLPVERTWALLTDLPRVAPCLPGAHLDEVVDGEYRGGLSAKIGPITARYAGSAWFTERDEVDRRAVIVARGKEERGSGSASATITTTLSEADGGTVVRVSTDLAISGRAAQFGRSLMADVSENLIGEFVRRLESMASGGARQTPATPEPVNVGATVLRPVLRRAALPVAAALLGAAAGVLGTLLAKRGS